MPSDATESILILTALVDGDSLKSLDSDSLIHFAPGQSTLTAMIRSSVLGLLEMEHGLDWPGPELPKVGSEVGPKREALASIPD